MAGSDSRRTAPLKTQQAELVKQYVVLDGQQRAVEIYTSHTDSVQGTPCSVVFYEYANATSSVVVKMKEDTAVWDATWDI